MSLHAATSRAGVDVCLQQDEGTEIPECPHGPMLLFERFFKDGHKPRKFFACSACRDRKNCAFFQWEDEPLSEIRRKTHHDIIEASRPPAQAIKMNKELKRMMKDGSSMDEHCDWLFCHDCNALVIGKGKEHEGHELTKGESLEELRKPSFILRPLENQKAQAQYLFSTKATQLIVNNIRKLGFKKVLCLGTPRIHEKIQHDRCVMEVKKKETKPLDSLLLDIDYRYGQFYNSSEFCWYNMFNHYFFNNASSEKRFLKFLETESDQEIVMVMDPPFGGLVEVLSCTIKQIWKLWRKQSSTEDAAEKEMPTLFIFPYFMESQMQSSLPSLNMMDYKVDYENHPYFKDKKSHGSKRGSPVRIFTNISPAAIKLPADEGYRFCKACQRYIAAENAHCAKCDACTSKDGRRYVHCDECGLCVKPGRVHCQQCERCEIPGHDCSRTFSSGCHICGEIGHKRRECPQRIQDKTQTEKSPGSKQSKKRKKQTHKPRRNKQQKTGS